MPMYDKNICYYNYAYETRLKTMCKRNSCREYDVFCLCVSALDGISKLIGAFSVFALSHLLH